MTREEAKKLLPFIQAFSEGKTIQSRCITGETPLWWDDNNPTFEIDDFDYRIKPEPKYRPFRTVQECLSEMLKHQPFGWLKPVNKCGNKVKAINISSIECDEYPIQFTNDFGDYSFKHLYEEFTFMDGTPFGIIEEE